MLSVFTATQINLDPGLILLDHFIKILKRTNRRNIYIKHLNKVKTVHICYAQYKVTIKLYILHA